MEHEQGGALYRGSTMGGGVCATESHSVEMGPIPASISCMSTTVWQMSVSLEGVKMAEKITVDIVDGTEFELEVDGLYRWDPPALPHGTYGLWDSPIGWVQHSAAERTVLIRYGPHCLRRLKVTLPAPVLDTEKAPLSFLTLKPLRSDSPSSPGAGWRHVCVPEENRKAKCKRVFPPLTAKTADWPRS